MADPSGAEPFRKPGRPADGDSEETRRRIDDTALRLFGAYGYAQTTVKSIALEAGLTSAAVYHYSPSKRDLFTALASSAIARAVGPLECAARRETALGDRLDALLTQMLATDEEFPDLARFMIVLTGDAARYPELRETYEAVIAAYTELCLWLASDAQIASEISTVADAPTVARMLAGAVLGITSLLASTPPGQHGPIVGCAKLLLSARLFTDQEGQRITSRRTGPRS